MPKAIHETAYAPIVMLHCYIVMMKPPEALSGGCSGDE
jgi:hypothetical protein